jgi:hypothetical protein
VNPQTNTAPSAVPVATPLPRPEHIPTREVIGVPLAMTDYEEAMDVMDGMIARGERGYVCAVVSDREQPLGEADL